VRGKPARTHSAGNVRGPMCKAPNGWYAKPSRKIPRGMCEARNGENAEPAHATFRGECARRRTVGTRNPRTPHSAGNARGARTVGTRNRHATFRGECTRRRTTESRNWKSSKNGHPHEPGRPLQDTLRNQPLGAAVAVLHGHSSPRHQIVTNPPRRSHATAATVSPPSARIAAST
jgi:hypothetical protein